MIPYSKGTFRNLDWSKSFGFKNTSPSVSNNASLDSLSPYLRTAAGTLAGLTAASKLDTNIETRTPIAPSFVYNDRSSFLKSRNNSTLRNLLSTRRGQPLNEKELLGRTLDANNQIALGEAQRKDAAIQNFNNTNLSINTSAVEAANRNNYYNNLLKNNKVAMQNDAFTSGLSNLDAIDREKSQRERDLKAIDAMYKGFTFGRQGAALSLKELLPNLDLGN